VKCRRFAHFQLANPGTEPARATVTFLPDSGVPVTKVYPIAGQQRVTLDIAAEDASLVGTAVGTQVGIFWSAGTNATASRLP
jgi:hypothetical protein